MIDDTELARLSPQERAQLMRALAAMDRPDVAYGGQGQFRRWALVTAAVTGALVLAAWIAVLSATLPRYYRSGGWSATWIGFDIALLVVLAVTAWSAWRRRQVLILCLIVLATLLCCDAWFDTALDWHTRGFMLSLLLALTVELPVATAAMIGARRLLRLTIGHMEHLDLAADGSIPSFWKVPLFGDASVGYRHLWAPSAADAVRAGGRRHGGTGGTDPGDQPGR